MISINKPYISYQPIADMINGYRTSHILLASIEKGIFSRLSDSKSAESLATEIGTDPRTTERFLNVLVSLKLLTKSDNKYVNTFDAETYLVEGKSHYIGNLIRITVGSNLLLSHIDKSMSNDGSLQDILKEHTFDEIQILGHAEGALHHELASIFETLKDIPEFTQATRVLDLGGAHGAYSMAFARNNSSTQVTMFDRPDIIPIGKKYVSRHGMENRIQFISGDFFEDDIGNGYDLVFISHVFYQKKGIETVLRKIHESLDDKGIIVLNHWVVNETRTGPRISSIFDLYGSIMNRDFYVFTVNEYTNLLEQAGFSNMRIFDIQIPSSPSMLIIGKKKE
jgi:predicted O-methyltransferase YrrM